MKIIINSASQVDMKERSIDYWQDEISAALERFSDWLTRVEVHITDENSNSKGGGDDIRCLIEARPANHQPVSIEVRGDSVTQAVQDAIDTIEKRLDTMLDKIRTESRKRS